MKQQQMYFIAQEDGTCERVANHEYPHAKDTWVGEGYLSAETSCHVCVEPPLRPLPRATLLLVMEPTDEATTIDLGELHSRAAECFKRYFGRFTLYDLIPGARYSLYKSFVDSHGHTLPAQDGLAFRFIRLGCEVCFLTSDGRYLEVYVEGTEDIDAFLRPENPIPSETPDDQD